MSSRIYWLMTIYSWVFHKTRRVIIKKRRNYRAAPLVRRPSSSPSSPVYINRGTTSADWAVNAVASNLLFLYNRRRVLSRSSWAKKYIIMVLLLHNAVFCSGITFLALLVSWACPADGKIRETADAIIIEGKI